jgi:hypothetical protein
LGTAGVAGSDTDVEAFRFFLPTAMGTGSLADFTALEPALLAASAVASNAALIFAPIIAPVVLPAAAGPETAACSTNDCARATGAAANTISKELPIA